MLFKNRLLTGATLLFATTAFATSNALADEGMWTFDQFPAAKMKKEYGFAPDGKWLKHVQNSAVRLSVGCSASFVSKNGLILTNWHCSESCVHDISTPENDFAKNGFVAKSREEERQCPGLSAEVLTEISDVTHNIKKATLGKKDSDIAKSRLAAMSKAEEEACAGLDKEKFNCELVTLYRGGQYKVYKYRQYNDVRLVFEPESDVGFFGGDPDNFNFPRFNLDSSFLRAYEDGKPVNGVEHLTWTTEVPKEGDAVFVAGNPGSTQRLKTVSQLEFTRDWELPVRQLVRSELRGRLIQFMKSSDEAYRTGIETLFGVENSYKAQYGQMRALMDKDFFAIKQKEEADLKAKVRASSTLRKQIGDPWSVIAKATDKQKDLFLAYDFIEARAGSISSLYNIARSIVRAGFEAQKPLADRLPGYSDAGIVALKRRVLAPAPVHKDQEIMGLEVWLSKTREYLTADSKLVQTLLGKDSPEDLAKALIAGTKLTDLKYREELLNGGKAAVLASDDPLIKFVLRTDDQARKIREQYMAEVEGPLGSAAEKIAEARFKVYGANVYPDATFTLRLSYGKVAGWTYNGVKVPAYTTMGGAYDRATGSFPFVLAKRWVDAESKIDKKVIFNLSTTNDIIGGNSGSPLIDKHGRVVGTAFDGNIHSLGGAYAFDSRVNRTISVTTAAIEEALKNIYGADWLVKELNGK